MKVDVTTNNTSKEDGVISFDMSAGKKSAFVIYTKGINCINVICQNAKHKSHRGVGKIFWGGWNQALSGYKSVEMKAMIKAAQQQSV